MEKSTTSSWWNTTEFYAQWLKNTADYLLSYKLKIKYILVNCFDYCGNSSDECFKFAELLKLLLKNNEQIVLVAGIKTRWLRLMIQRLCWKCWRNLVRVFFVLNMMDQSKYHNMLNNIKKWIISSSIVLLW